MTFPLAIPEPVRSVLPPGTGVLLGISGGVDSALTLALLTELGCEVQCVTFKNFCYGDAEESLTEKSCCSLDAINDARSQARQFGAVHWVGDLEKPFRREVIDPFVAEYAAARTPNPCLACNSDVRFPELVRLAARQGCAYAATGHYARIDRTAGDSRLLRGLDPAKDQSYFLHRIDRGLFANLVFPLGWYRKDQVRAAAHELGLSVAGKRDSQEICFVPDGDRSFLFPPVSGSGPGIGGPGDIVDRQGQVLGRHRGLVHYTVGQRKGLGIAAAHPLYVLELDPEQGRLVVGPQEDLAVDRLTGDRFLAAVNDLPVSWSQAEPGGLLGSDGPVTVRIRHRHQGATVSAWYRTGDGIEVDLQEPVFGAAPGQGLVLYSGDTVLGGGRLCR